MNAIYYLCFSDNIYALDYILIEYPDLDSNGYYQAIGAVSSGNEEMIKHVFLKENVQLNLRLNGNELLYNASKTNLQTLQYLLHNNNLKYDNNQSFCKTMLHGACESNSIEIVKYLINEMNENDIFKVNDNYENSIDLAMNNNVSIELKILLCNILFDTLLSNKLTYRHHLHYINHSNQNNNHNNSNYDLLNNNNNPIFRYNMPLKNIKLYFEIIIETTDKMQFGCCSSDYDPTDTSFIESESTQVISIDGSCQFIYKHISIISTNIPIWKEGTIIGIQIDMIEHEIYFAFDGIIIQLDKKDSNLMDFIDIMPVFCLSNNQKCKLNFGEELFQYMIPNGYISLYEYNNQKKKIYLQVYDNIKNNWIYPFKYLTHNYQNLIRIINNDNNSELLSIMLEKYTANVAEIANMVDDSDRTVLSMSSNKCKKIFQKYLFFMSRYDFSNVRAEYKSLTCAVYIAIDNHTKNTVTIKLMKNKQSFQRELTLRNEFDVKYIVPVIDSYDGDDNEVFRAELSRKELSEYNYCIIMPAIERNLQRIMTQEQNVVKNWKEIQHICIEIIECLNHLHSKGVIHGKFVHIFQCFRQ